MEKQVSEGSLHKWFKGSKSKDGKGGWVNVVTGGTCASDEPGEGTPKCVSSAKRASMTKAERLSAARRKKKADPGQQQKSGAAKPTYVSTDKKKKKMKESYTRTLTPLSEKAQKCWKGYEKKGTKKMFGKTYNNCVKKEEVEIFNEVMSQKKRQEIQDAGGIENYKKLNPSPPISPNLIKLNTGAVDKDGKFKPIKRPDSNAGLPDHIMGPGPGQYRPKSDKGDYLKPDIKVRMPDKTKKDMRMPPMPERRVFSKEEIEIQESDKKGKGSGSKDACYHKVKSRYSVWPSAYASGALVKCRKVGAANWGNSSKKEDLSDWKGEFIWEDGDFSKKLEEKKKYQGNPFKKKPGLVDKALKKLDDSIPIKIIDTDVKEEMTERVDEGLDIVDLGKKVSKKIKNFIDRPIIAPTINQKDYQKRVKDGTTNQLIEPQIKKEEVSNWRDELEEDWQKTNRQDKTDGMSQKAVNAYKRENPGSKLKTAVTQKPSTLKRGSKKAKRRKSFCSRMKGMKKRLTSAKTARDPDSRINKALRRWNC